MNRENALQANLGEISKLNRTYTPQDLIEVCAVRPPHNQRITAPEHQWAEQKGFIAARLRWVGNVNRKHVQARFLVSGTAATAIMQRYVREVGGMSYSVNAKTYLFSEETTATRVVTLDQARAFGALDSSDYSLLEKVAVQEPLPDVTRMILQAIDSHGTVAVSYFNNKQDEPEEHVVNPLRLLVDGDRWHVRAYCHKTATFEFFELHRLEAARMIADIPSPRDADWEIVENVQVLDPREGPQSIPVRRATRCLVEAKLAR